MKKIHFVLFFLLLMVQATYAQLTTAQKLIVTITDDWNSNKATVYMFDKSNNGWKKRREEFSVSIGKNGLGWGEGLHPNQPGEFVKKEGDKRSPAGIFELDTIFYGMNDSAPEGVRLPYRQLTTLTRCVDDTGSSVYNSIVEEDSTTKDWKSAEKMKNVVPDYKYVLVVKHNANGKKGKGSCIFFHTNNVPTSGCTSMDEENMVTLLHWLDPNKKTLIIQLPHEEYHRLRMEWNLPKLLNN